MRLRHLFCALATTCTLAAQGYGVSNRLIDVEVIDEFGHAFPTFATGERHLPGERRAYLEARPGEAYALRVTNRSNQRVGLVIAVDGRNVISGRKSRLHHSEKMYVLKPWQTARYEGWRTARNRVNEFYFTSDLDSYAGAFGDFSAMGVVAVAAFEGLNPRPAPAYREKQGRSEYERKGGHGDSPASRAAPGTGFGDERYSPAYRVKFAPKREATSRTFIKYEWRQTLCRMGVTRCAQDRNRFWPQAQLRRRHSDRGYAAYPPGYRYRERGVTTQSRGLRWNGK